MEFHEKLQQLRGQKGLTQEDLAQALYVSRTAVSKWESGRGYPNIDSLRAIAQFYGVTVDALLSGDQLLTIAEEERKQTKRGTCDLVFGLLDVSAMLYLFLPLFGQGTEDAVRAVGLLYLTDISPYLRLAYFAVVGAMATWGILTLALQICKNRCWLKIKAPVSSAINGIGVLVLILSRQPYGAALLFVFLSIKVLLLLKKR